MGIWAPGLMGIASGSLADASRPCKTYIEKKAALPDYHQIF